MGIEAFFHRPGTNKEINERLITDIKYAKKSVLLSMAYLTDTVLKDALVNNTSASKRVIFNAQDMKRKDSENIRDIYVQLTNSIGENQVAIIGQKVEDSSLDKELYYTMHHKFIVIDESILWVGSYNASIHANNCNWENMLRITEGDIISFIMFKNLIEIFC